ncbi:MmyB family transcriptional regulator [Streptomyces lydicus]|uniref:MmyB family transcriptional regulator n=1 Tax=Streptomyces lydicus TaxID=47763 RepID=UPI00384AD53B
MGADGGPGSRPPHPAHGGPSACVRYTPQDRRAPDATHVAELRATASRYPADRRLRRLIAELRAHSERFAELWDSGAMAAVVGTQIFPGPS